MLPIRFCRSVAVLAIFSFCGPARIAFCQGATYPKIEASFNITGLATDPFDYTVTDVRVQITQPDCTTLSLPAFFDGGTTWRVRHTPAIGGRYSIAGVTLNGAPVSVSNLQPASWTVAGPPTDLGFVKIDPSNARRFITSNGKRFYPRGEDVAWSTSAANAVNIMPKMGLAHENWSRVWMTHFSAGSGLGLNLDWPKVNNTFGQLSLPVAANWDAIVAAAEQSGLHFQMTLQHHGQYSTTTDANWSSNPYNTALGGFLANPTNFFTDATAKALTKRKLRYAVARWGYSTSLMAWELFNEVQFTDAANAHQWTVIQAWHNEMAAFLRSQDSYQHLITTSSVLNQPIWDQTDYYQHHDYPSAPSIISGLRNATDITGSQPVRPDFGGECGTNGTPHLGVNAPIWAGLMAGQSGNEMPWYWDGIDAANDYIYFRAMSDFVTVSGLGDQDVLTKSAPAVTTSPGGLLSAYAVGNTNFEALYVWSPNNVFNPSASTTAAGTLSVSGLNPGTYSASWWDTFAGVVISNFTVTVPDANPVSVNTPAILRSAALYVGLPPQAGITAPVLTQTVGTNSPAFSFPITLANSGGLPLGYSLSITGASPVLYTAINSTQPGGPTFVWKDISAVGFDIVTNFTALAAPKTARDEGIAGPIDIGFAFPFFSGSQTPALFTQLYVSANGYVAFSPFGGDTSTNTVLPNSLAPSNCIAFFWDDLDLGNSFTHVYIAQDLIAQTFTVEFQNARIKGTFVNVTCQLVLKSTGEILIQYLAASSATSSCTVGVQNAAGDQGLTVAFNQSFVQPNMAIRLTPTPWLSFSSSAGYVPPSKSETVTVALNAGGLAAGTYSATILVNTTDSLQPVTALPVSLVISPDLPAAPSGLIVTSVTWSQVALSWTDNDGNASGYQIERKTGVGGTYGAVGTVGAGLNSFADTTVASRTTYYYRVLATNDFGSSIYSGEVCAMTPFSPRDTWRQVHFGAPDNSGPGADTADPDGDGLINIIEYAFNLDPNAPSPNPIFFAMVGGQLTVTFSRTHPAPADITYLIEVSDDLTSGIWNSGPAYTSQTMTDNGDGTETVVVTDADVVSSTSAHFLRIRIATQ